MFFTLLLFFSVKLYGMAAVNNINLRWDTREMRERFVKWVPSFFYFLPLWLFPNFILFYFKSHSNYTILFYVRDYQIDDDPNISDLIWTWPKKLNLHKILMSGCMTWFCVCYKTVIHPHLNSFFITLYKTHYKLIILN